VHAPYILENKTRKLYAKNDGNFNLPETYEEVRTCTLPFISYLKETLENDFKIGTYTPDKKILDTYLKVYNRLNLSIKTGTELIFCNASENKSYLDTYHRAYYDTLFNKYDPQAVKHQSNLYDSKIVELDEYLKKVFDFVKSKNLKNKTVIIVTSDHGEEFMEHGALGHGYNLYDTTLKVPMVLSVPGVGNTQIEKLYQSVDILPTLLGILNIKTKAMFAGTNIFESLTFPQKNYSEAQQNNKRVIRDEKWKIFYRNSYSDGKIIGTEMYEYRQDPHETNNLLYKNPQIQNDLFMNLSK
jgi:arylsulfatase A-like enzyme